MKENKLIIKKSPAKKGEDGYKIFSIRIKEELASQIDAIASETGRSRNELIGKFLEFAISHFRNLCTETDDTGKIQPADGSVADCF